MRTPEAGPHHRTLRSAPPHLHFPYSYHSELPPVRPGEILGLARASPPLTSQLPTLLLLVSSVPRTVLVLGKQEKQNMDCPRAAMGARAQGWWQR